MRSVLRQAILARVDPDLAHVELAIEVDSDPISGSVATEHEKPRKFSGWIELVAAIEDARGGRLAAAQAAVAWLHGPDPAKTQG